MCVGSVAAGGGGLRGGVRDWRGWKEGRGLEVLSGGCVCVCGVVGGGGGGFGIFMVCFVF